MWRRKKLFLSWYNHFNFFVKEEFQKINLEGLNNQEFISILIRQWRNISELKILQRNRSDGEFPKGSKEGKSGECVACRGKKKKLEYTKSQDNNYIKDKKEDFYFYVLIWALYGKSVVMFLIEDEDSAYGLILEYGKYEEEYDVQIVVDENGKEKKIL